MYDMFFLIVSHHIVKAGKTFWIARRDDNTEK